MLDRSGFVVVLLVLVTWGVHLDRYIDPFLWMGTVVAGGIGLLFVVAARGLRNASRWAPALALLASSAGAGAGWFVWGAGAPLDVLEWVWVVALSLPFPIVAASVAVGWWRTWMRR